MTQPNQHSFTRSQIRQWARQGLLTPERIAAIEDAVKRGQVHNDIGGAPAPADTGTPPKPQVGGTEIKSAVPQASRFRNGTFWGSW